MNDALAPCGSNRDRHANIGEGLIGERELQALPRTAFVLNPARGPIIQQEALLRARRSDGCGGLSACRT